MVVPDFSWCDKQSNFYTKTQKPSSHSKTLMTVTGCQLPCPDQAYSQSGPWSLPLAPQTQWPYLFKQTWDKVSFYRLFYVLRNCKCRINHTYLFSCWEWGQNIHRSHAHWKKRFGNTYTPNTVFFLSSVRFIQSKSCKQITKH